MMFGKGVFCRPLRDIPSLSALMNRHDGGRKTAWNSRAVTLLELLVAMALVAILASLVFPAWRTFSSSRGGKVAAAAVMDSLEQARITAVSAGTEVWVVFRSGKSPDQGSLRILTRVNTGYLPTGPWRKLPIGVTFRTGPGTLMGERPPADILGAATGPTPPAGKEEFGGVLFNRAGRVILPAPGANKLSLILKGGQASPSREITLARGTGRAFCMP